MTGVAIPKIDAPLVGSKHQTGIIPQKKLNPSCRENPRNVIPPSMELFAATGDPESVVSSESFFQLVNIPDDPGPGISIDQDAIASIGEVIQNWD